MSKTSAPTTTAIGEPSESCASISENILSAERSPQHSVGRALNIRFAERSSQHSVGRALEFQSAERPPQHSVSRALDEKKVCPSKPLKEDLFDDERPNRTRSFANMVDHDIALALALSSPVPSCSAPRVADDVPCMPRFV